MAVARDFEFLTFDSWLDVADRAGAVAKVYGVKTRTGTIFILFRLISLGLIEAAECEMLLDELVESGLYVDSHTLVRARQKIRESSAKRH